MSIVSFLVQWMDPGGRSTMAGRAGRRRSASLLAQNRRVKKPVRSSMTKKVGFKTKSMKGGKGKDEEKKEEKSTMKEPPLNR